MKILMVTHLYAEQHGGEQIAARELGLRWSFSGHSITWAASGTVSEQDRKPFKYLILKAWNPLFMKFGIPYPFLAPSSFFRLGKAVYEADLVHIHDSLFMGSLAAVFFGKLLRKKIVITQHISLIPYSNPLLRILMKAGTHLLVNKVLAITDQVVFYSEEVKRYFDARVKYSSPPAFVMNGIDYERFGPSNPELKSQLRAKFGLQEKERICLFVGRFIEKKGMETVRQLAIHFGDIKFLMVGEGPIKPSEWKLPNVLEIGRVEHWEVGNYYRVADLLVLPSVGEGFPFVIQEAMACGLACLTSEENKLAMPELSHYCFSAKPDAKNFLTAFESIWKNGKSLTDMADEGVSFAKQHWCWTKCAEQYLELFRKLFKSSESTDANSYPISLIKSSS